MGARADLDGLDDEAHERNFGSLEDQMEEQPGGDFEGDIGLPNSGELHDNASGEEE